MKSESKEKIDLEKERQGLVHFMKTNIDPKVLKDIEYINSLTSEDEKEFEVKISHKGT